MNLEQKLKEQKSFNKEVEQYRENAQYEDEKLKLDKLLMKRREMVFREYNITKLWNDTRDLMERVENTSIVQDNVNDVFRKFKGWHVHQKKIQKLKVNAEIDGIEEHKARLKRLGIFEYPKL